MGEVRIERQTNRVAEMILGILGSVLGMFHGMLVLMLGIIKEIGSIFNFLGIIDFSGIPDSVVLYRLGLVIIVACIVTFALCLMINVKRVLVGILLIIGGMLNFIYIGLLGILAGSLILAAGILALVRK